MIGNTSFANNACQRLMEHLKRLKSQLERTKRKEKQFAELISISCLRFSRYFMVSLRSQKKIENLDILEIRG